MLSRCQASHGLSAPRNICATLLLGQWSRARSNLRNQICGAVLCCLFGPSEFCLGRWQVFPMPAIRHDEVESEYCSRTEAQQKTSGTLCSSFIKDQTLIWRLNYHPLWIVGVKCGIAAHDAGNRMPMRSCREPYAQYEPQFAQSRHRHRSESLCLTPAHVEHTELACDGDRLHRACIPVQKRGSRQGPYLGGAFSPEVVNSLYQQRYSLLSV